jgi:hypothetical protein
MLAVTLHHVILAALLFYAGILLPDALSGRHELRWDARPALLLVAISLTAVIMLAIFDTMALDSFRLDEPGVQLATIVTARCLPRGGDPHAPLSGVVLRRENVSEQSHALD